MNANDKKRLAEFERDIKKMQKDHEKTFADFNKKKSPPKKLLERIQIFLKGLLTRRRQ